MTGRLLLVALLGTAACRSGRRDTNDAVQAQPPGPPSAAPGVSGTPRIDRLSPDSIRLAPNTLTSLTIRGGNFAASATNTVRVGPIVLTQIAATGSGTVIDVIVPARYTTNAEAPPRPLSPGMYAVSVENAGGTSNSASLKVIP